LVKKKFRELSTLYHPDKQSQKSASFRAQAEERYMKITEAYETIKAYESNEREGL